MHTCPVCKRTLEDEALYCPGCGAAQPKTPLPSNAQFQSSLSPPPYPSIYSSPAPVAKSKNPWIAALLNFFIPGAGYIYNGVGYDGPQVVFGIIVLLSVFIGFYIPLVGQAFLPSGSSATSGAGSVSAIEVLSILLLILPFGLAYDAFRRASRTLLH
ncbi:MAG: hypothetical protein ACYCQJ_05060 [Nitrososphaerales archaeon]